MATIVNGEFIPMEESERIELLIDELEDELGEDIDTSEGSVLGSLVRSQARATADVEESLKNIYESAFLETATGIELDRLVELVGMSRREAVRTTGVSIFSRDEPTHTTFTIQSGTTVQTDEEQPIRFQTRHPAQIPLYDDFGDDLDDYEGDNSSFTITDESLVYDSAAADDTIYNTDIDTHRGHLLHIDLTLTSSSVARTLFGTTDADNTYYVELDAGTDTVRLFEREDGTDTELSSESVSLTAADYTIDIDWGLDYEISVSVVDSSDTEIVSLTETDETFIEGGFGFEEGSTEATEWHRYTASRTAATIRAVEGGVSGNVGRNTLTIMPSPPSGVDTTTNPRATGDTTSDNIQGNSYRTGVDEEGDSELRQRVRDTVAGRGRGTHDALAAAIRQLNGVSSVGIEMNRTFETDANGLPPVSFEAIVFGGGDTDIAETIFDVAAATARPVGGNLGTLVEETVESDVTGQNYDIAFSRPVAVDVEIEIDIVVTDEYIGDEPLTDEIINFIGGERTDGTTALGLNPGTNVREDELKDTVVGSDTGVIGTKSISTTPSFQTDADGLQSIVIDTNQVANIASTTDITITTTEA